MFIKIPPTLPSLRGRHTGTPAIRYVTRHERASQERARCRRCRSLNFSDDLKDSIELVVRRNALPYPEPGVERRELSLEGPFNRIQEPATE